MSQNEKSIISDEDSQQEIFIRKLGYTDTGYKNYNFNEIVKSFSYGENHVFLLTIDNKVLVFGKNRYGQLGLGNYLDEDKTFIENKLLNEEIYENIKLINCGANHTFILTKKNELFATGDNVYGQLGLLTNKNNLNTFTKIEFKHKIKKIISGYSFSYILTEDNTLYGTGQNKYGQLCSLVYNNKFEFNKIATIPNDLKEIHCGNYHSILLTVYGTLYGCGRNDKNQLGDNKSKFLNQFTKIEIPFRVINASCGGYCTFVMNELCDIYFTGFSEKREYHTFTKIEELFPNFKLINTFTSKLSVGFTDYEFYDNNNKEMECRYPMRPLNFIYKIYNTDGHSHHPYLYLIPGNECRILIGSKFEINLEPELIEFIKRKLKDQLELQNLNPFVDIGIVCIGH